MARPLGPVAGDAPPASHPGAGGKLAALTHNKPLMLWGGGAAAVLAAVVYVRGRNKSKTDTLGIADGSSLAGTPGNPASLNTVGTDVASQLGQYGAAQAATLQDFIGQATKLIAAGATIPPDTASGGGVAPTTSAPATSSNPLLRQGSSGSVVSQLQTALNARGYHLAVDGKFGPLTAAAVRQFQAAQHIAVDGVVGPITWGKLS